MSKAPPLGGALAFRRRWSGGAVVQGEQRSAVGDLAPSTAQAVDRGPHSHNGENAGQSPAFSGCLPLITTTPPPGVCQGPARPQGGAGRFTLALTGAGAVEYPPTGANALTAGVAGCGGVLGAFAPSPGLALSYGFWSECRGPLLLSGRISLTHACAFGWID